MSIAVIVLIAIGLSIDSFAVSVADGLTIRNLSLKNKLLIAFSFAIFQALMPLIGWYAGTGIAEYVKEVDHWVAFILLAFIGSKMIYESFYSDETIKNTELSFLTIITQSFATSVDAFAVGISFALLDFSIVISTFIIGIITFIASIIGLQLGKFLGKRVGKYIEIIGGIVLISIGLKILIEHLYF
ncbi:MAG: manganese efflux pump [Chlorobi bacterium]|nr:manganese efflux pump [Chlorobiota bacterium]